MNRQRIIILLVMLFMMHHHGSAQRSDNIKQQVATIRHLLARADTLTSLNEALPDMGDTILELNYNIAARLTRLLQTPAIVKYDPAVLLADMDLGIAVSKDKRLSVISLFENTGGSWKSYINIIQYRNTTGKPIALYGSTSMDNAQDSGLLSTGASFYKIYKLKSGCRSLYLCLGEGTSCNTCTYRTASVVELAGNGINLTYPAFKNQSNDADKNKLYDATYELETRMGNIKKFNFDPKTKTLQIEYVTDDVNSRNEGYGKIRREKFVFNGRYFAQ